MNQLRGIMAFFEGLSERMVGYSVKTLQHWLRISDEEKK